MYSVKLIKNLNIYEINKCYDLIDKNIYYNQDIDDDFNEIKQIILYYDKKDIIGILGLNNNKIYIICVDSEYKNNEIEKKLINISKIFSKNIEIYINKKNKKKEDMINILETEGYVLNNKIKNENYIIYNQ